VSLYPGKLHHPVHRREEPGQVLPPRPSALAQPAVPVQGPATTTQTGKGLDIYRQADGGSDKGVIESVGAPILHAPSQGTTGGAGHGKDHRGYQRAWLCSPPRSEALLYPILRGLSSTSQAAPGMMCIVHAHSPFWLLLILLCVGFIRWLIWNIPYWFPEWHAAVVISPKTG
jgi:hypothetical protein